MQVYACELCCYWTVAVWSSFNTDIYTFALILVLTKTQSCGSWHTAPQRVQKSGDLLRQQGRTWACIVFSSEPPSSCCPSKGRMLERTQTHNFCSICLQLPTLLTLSFINRVTHKMLKLNRNRIIHQLPTLPNVHSVLQLQFSTRYFLKVRVVFLALLDCVYLWDLEIWNYF